MRQTQINRQAGPEMGNDPYRWADNKKKTDITPMLPLTEIKRCFYGATYALGQLAKATGLSEDLNAVFPADYSSLLALAYYLVLSLTAAKQKFGRWAELHHLPDDVSHLSSHSVGNVTYLALTRRSCSAIWLTSL